MAEYALAIIALSNRLIGKLERTENEAMRIILKCARHESCTVMKYLLDIHSTDTRIKLPTVQSKLKIRADKVHRLHGELVRAKGKRLSHVKDAIHEVCPPVNIDPEQGWLPAPSKFKIRSVISYYTRQRMQKHVPAALDAAANALIS